MVVLRRLATVGARWLSRHDSVVDQDALSNRRAKDGDLESAASSLDVDRPAQPHSARQAGLALAALAHGHALRPRTPHRRPVGCGPAGWATTTNNSITSSAPWAGKRSG